MNCFRLQCERIPAQETGSQSSARAVLACPARRFRRSLRQGTFILLTKLGPVAVLRIQNPVLFWPLGSRMGFIRIPDPQPIFLRAWGQFFGSSSVADPGSGAFLTRNPRWVLSGSRIPNPYFWELSAKLLVQKVKCFLYPFKTKVI